MLLSLAKLALETIDRSVLCERFIAKQCVFCLPTTALFVFPRLWWFLLTLLVTNHRHAGETRLEKQLRERVHHHTNTTSIYILILLLVAWNRGTHSKNKVLKQ